MQSPGTHRYVKLDACVHVFRLADAGTRGRRRKRGLDGGTRVPRVAGELTSRPGRSRSGPDAIEIDLELREERRAQAGRALVLDDEPVRCALQLVELQKAGVGIHNPVVPDAVAGVERGLGNPISATRPGREDLDGEVRWALDRALGDDRFPAR